MYFHHVFDAHGFYQTEQRLGVSCLDIWKVGAENDDLIVNNDFQLYFFIPLKSQFSQSLYSYSICVRTSYGKTEYQKIINTALE